MCGSGCLVQVQPRVYLNGKVKYRISTVGYIMPTWPHYCAHVLVHTIMHQCLSINTRILMVLLDGRSFWICWAVNMLRTWMMWMPSIDFIRGVLFTHLLLLLIGITALLMLTLSYMAPFKCSCTGLIERVSRCTNIHSTLSNHDELMVFLFGLKALTVFQWLPSLIG